MPGLFTLGIVLVLGTAPPGVASSAPAPVAETSPALVPAVLTAINAERVKAGLAPLVADPGLDEAAREWAAVAARRQALVHRKDLKSLMTRGGWSTINENIYMGSGFMTAERIVRTWMNSPGHRKNLLAVRIQAAGLGLARSSAGDTYAVFNGAGR
jgi:uncharacterized protein YkwD